MTLGRRVGLTAACALLAGTFTPARGQERARPPAPPLPVFGAETRVVALPVFVTDKNGKAISGLTAADFEVEDGGKRAEVVAFQAVDAGAAPLATKEGTPAVEAATRRQFLLLFDLGYSTPSGLSRARAAAATLVAKSLGPRDLAAVATMGASGPNMLVGFTSDRAQLKSAIAGLGLAASDRLRDPLGLAWDLNAKIQETASGLAFESDDDREAVFQLMRSEQEAYRRRVGAYVAGLDALASMLNAVPGRKQVLLFSAGFDQSVLSGSQGAERQEASRAVAEGRLWEVQSDNYFGDASARGGLDQLFRRLGAADAVMHTVDIGGLAAAADVTDETRVAVGRGRDSLAQLASGSGGLFLKEVNDVGAALGDVMDASRYFYVLGFAPPEEGKPGRFRKLSVKVRRAGAKVSHRVGYLVADPKAPFDANAARLTAGDAIAKGLSGGAFGLDALAVPLARGAPVAADLAPGGFSLLPVVLQVDGAGLLSGVTEDKLALEIYGYVLDANGRILDALSTTPSLDLAKVRRLLLEDGLQVLTVFRAPEGTADLRFLVRHPASGRAASLRVLVPADPTTAWPVSSPLVMSDPASRLVLPVSSRANPKMDLPFRVGPRPFSPEVDPAFRNGVAREVCVMARPPRGPSLEVMADLRSADGKMTALETNGPVRLVKDRDGAFRIVLSLTPSGIAAGDYALRVTLRDEEGGEVFAEQSVGVR